MRESKIAACQRAYAMRFFKHAGLRGAWDMRVGLVVFLLSGLVFTSVVVVRLLAGGRPATTYLFCFAKKGMPKKATQSRCPCGIPNCASRKMGNEANSLRSDSFTSNPFSAPHNWQRHMRIRVKSRVKTNVKIQVKGGVKNGVKSQVKTQVKPQIKTQVKSTGLP
ncbi:hypothetical protein [Undibacterium sp. Ren11W]|uniref:hypothetical protein n=1 Tax=Undibacterium sp. Ren11W TaxID=3413045 RepID=UPI003BF5D82E